MKTFFTVIILMFFVNVLGQSLTEPGYLGDCSLVDVAGAVPLEKSRMTVKSTGNASLYITGVGKVSSKCYVQGIVSPVRIIQKDTIRIIVHVKDITINPVQSIGVFQMEQNQKKNARFKEVLSTGTFSSTESKMDYLQFTAERFGNSSFIITLVGLAKGEYAVSVSGVDDYLNLFGID